MKNDLYKKFIIYELSDDLKNIDCYSSNFILNWKDYFEDEEFIQNNSFVKCPYCDYENIKRVHIQNRDFHSFIMQNNIFFSRKNDYQGYTYLKQTMELLSILDGYAYIDFCDNCKKVITVNEKPFFLCYYNCATDYERLYMDEKFFKSNRKPVYCPSCNCQNFFSEEDYENENIEHIYCVRCKNYICTKKEIGNMFEYYIHMHYFGKKFII